MRLTVDRFFIALFVIVCLFLFSAVALAQVDDPSAEYIPSTVDGAAFSTGMLFTVLGGEETVDGAFDGLTSTYIDVQGERLTTVGYQFAGAKTIRRVAITAKRYTPNIFAPESFTVEYWDGDSWEVALSVSDETWTDKVLETRYFDIPTAYTSDQWRIVPISTDPRIYEIEMFEMSEPPIVVTPDTSTPVVIEIPPLPTAGSDASMWIAYALTVALIVYVAIDKLFQLGSLKTLQGNPLLQLGLNTAGSITQMTPDPQDDEFVQRVMRAFGYEVHVNSDGSFYANPRPTVQQLDKQIYGSSDNPAEVTDASSKKLLQELEGSG